MLANMKMNWSRQVNFTSRSNGSLVSRSLIICVKTR